MSTILHNPKSHAPAIYIPCWLSQVPTSELKLSSKVVYGRLAQWASSNGKAHRSASQLSKETGIPARTVESSIKELKEKGLIGSFQVKDGGHNHYEFYHHRWMNEPIVDELCYKSDSVTPPADFAVPPADFAVPSADFAVHKIKEIKEIKENIKHLSSDKPMTKKISASDYEKDENFMRFYKAYPVRKKGAHAYKMWLRLNPDDALIEIILNDVEKREAEDTQWIEGFIPHPGTYLNPECPGWKDEIVNRDKIRNDNKKAHDEAIDLENKRRMEKQEEASKQRAERERLNDFQKKSDSLVYRKTVKESAYITAAASDALRGIKTRLGRQ